MIFPAIEYSQLARLVTGCFRDGEFFVKTVKTITMTSAKRFRFVFVLRKCINVRYASLMVRPWNTVPKTLIIEFTM